MAIEQGLISLKKACKRYNLKHPSSEIKARLRQRRQIAERHWRRK
jgi:hypothetical protein